MNLLEETIEDFNRHCDNDGQSEYAVPRILNSLVLAQRPACAVEIGSNMGLCSMAIASALKFNAEHKPNDFLRRWKEEYHPIKAWEAVRGRLFCIDPVLQPHFARRLNAFPLQEFITFVQKRSDQVRAEDFPPIDFLFIDGDHSYKAARHDFSTFFHRVTPGGYIVIHDYFPNSPTSQMLWWGPNVLSRQIRESFGLQDSLVIDTGFQSLAIFRKKSDHIDLDFFGTNMAKVAVQFYLRKYRKKLEKWMSGGDQN